MAFTKTTVDEVKKIIETDLEDDDVTSYIESTYAFLDNVLSTKLTDGALLTRIHQWVTAHFLASTREQQLSSAEAGSAKAKFQGMTGMRLESTHYGQNAMVMDTTGTLTDLNTDGQNVYFSAFSPRED